MERTDKGGRDERVKRGMREGSDVGRKRRMESTDGKMEGWLGGLID